MLQRANKVSCGEKENEKEKEEGVPQLRFDDRPRLLKCLNPQRAVLISIVVLPV